MPEKNVSLTANSVHARMYLYRNGDLCTKNSGGWTFVARSVENYLASNASISYGSSFMTLSAMLNSNKMGDGSVYTKKAINLSNYSKLYAKVSANASAGVNAESDTAFMIFTSVMTPSDKPTWSHGVILDRYTSTTTVSIDISKVNVSRQIGFWVWTGEGSVSIKVHEVWLEK